MREMFIGTVQTARAPFGHLGIWGDLGGLAWPGGPFLSNGDLSVPIAHSKQAWPGLAWPVWGWHVGCGMRSYHIRPYIFSRPDFGTNHLIFRPYRLGHFKAYPLTHSLTHSLTP